VQGRKRKYSKWKKFSIDYERFFYFYENSLERKLYDLELDSIFGSKLLELSIQLQAKVII
jgi:hypothetical protein